MVSLDMLLSQPDPRAPGAGSWLPITVDVPQRGWQCVGHPAGKGPPWAPPLAAAPCVFLPQPGWLGKPSVFLGAGFVARRFPAMSSTDVEGWREEENPGERGGRPRKAAPVHYLITFIMRKTKLNP